jgi:glucuronyl/N-acetylglucosaminyl transferase EXT1
MLNKKYLILYSFIFTLVLIVLLYVNVYLVTIQRFDGKRPLIISSRDKSSYKSVIGNRFPIKSTTASTSNGTCTMQACFNFSKCLNDFKIYIYEEPYLVLSDTFKSILRAINESKYITKNGDEACLFVSSIDTFDRDRLSPNYVSNLQSLLENLKYWNNSDGINHLIFNSYTGTWPYYKNEFQISNDTLINNKLKAIIIRSSFSTSNYRYGFDISFPLIESSFPYETPKIKQSKPFNNNTQYIKKRYLLTFKGKRYLGFGAGTDTRGNLYHINNNRDILLLTTCRHLKFWEQYKDEKCDHDNQLYDKYYRFN